MGSTRRRGVGRVAAGLVIAAAIVLTVGVAPASAAPKGTIAGTVLDRFSAPLSGVQVQVLNATYGNVVGTATTDGSGTYTVANLNPNQFRVRFISPNAADATMWSGGLTWSTATKHTVTAGATTTVDQTLAASSPVAGTVAAGSTGIPGMVAVLLGPDLPYEAVGAAMTAADGSYYISNVVPASYKLAFIDPAFLTLATQPASMRPEIYDDLDMISLSLATAFASATPVVAAGGLTVANASLRGMDCTFSAGADLSGTDLSGANLKGCDLAGVDLGTVNLTGANLHWATGTPAAIGGAVWSNTTCPDGTNSDDPGNGGTCNFAPIVSGTPGSGAVAEAYTFSYAVDSNTSFTSSVLSGALPAGVSLASDTISGTPTAAGTATGVIRFTSSVGHTDVPFSITVGLGTQTVSFTTSPAAVVWKGGPGYTVGATASTGLTVTYALGAGTTNNACSIVGNAVSFDDVGVCEIVASQAGDADWLPASSSQSMNVKDVVGSDCAWVQGLADHTSLNLPGVDLHNCDLTGFDFNSSNFAGAFLWGANLTGTSFYLVNGGSANFSYATLDGTNLSGNFPSATFAYAVATNVNMLNAWFPGAEGTHIGGWFNYSAITVCSDSTFAFQHGDTCDGYGYGW